MRTAKEKTEYHRAQASNLTGYLGVTRHNQGDGYVAKIRVPARKHKVYCGFSKDPRQAAIYYDRFARKFFGAEAVTNFDE